jgi:uncharacterized protein YggL (DUF469 family)
MLVIANEKRMAERKLRLNKKLITTEFIEISSLESAAQDILNIEMDSC